MEKWTLVQGFDIKYKIKNELGSGKGDPLLVIEKLKKIKLPDKASIKEDKDQKLSISYDRNKIKTDQLLDCLRSQGIVIMDLSTEEADLADVFRLLTKNS